MCFISFKDEEKLEIQLNRILFNSGNQVVNFYEIFVKIEYFFNQSYEAYSNHNSSSWLNNCQKVGPCKRTYDLKYCQKKLNWFLYNPSFKFYKNQVCCLKMNLRQYCPSD